MDEKEKRLYPGDVGYKGGDFHTTIYENGKVKDAHIIKDSNGNIVYIGITDKILGIF